MPRKNFYIKDHDLELFEKAEQLADGDNLSATIVEAVRQYVSRKEAEAQEMEEHAFEVGRWSEHDKNTQRIKFYGRLLASGDEYIGQTSDRRDRGRTWKIFQTAASKIIVRCKEWSAWQNSQDIADYQVLDSLPGPGEYLEGELTLIDFQEIPGNILEEAGKVLGQEVVKWIE